MKRLKNILISGILSVGMVVTSMPIEALAQEIVPGQEEDGTPEENLYEIVSFEELPEEVCNRNVPVGTALEELNLPETLTVSYRLHTEKQDDEEETDQEPGGNPDDAPGEDGSGSVSGDDIGDDAGDEGNEGNPGEGAGDEGTGENPGDGAENEGNPGDSSGEEGGEDAPGDDSGNSGDESTPGDDGNEDSPGNNSGDEGNGGDSGNGSGDGGTEENPGGGTGDEGSGGSPGGDTSDEGNGGSPDGDSGEEGSGSGGDTGDGGNVSSPDGGSGSEANGGDSNIDSGNAGHESNPDSNAGNGGTVGNSAHDSADEAVVEQKTVEVHMKEYKFQPAFAASFGILTQGGEKADSDGNPAADQEADGDDDSDSNSDSGSESDAGTGTDTDTDTDGGSGPDTDKDSDTETGAGADKGSDTGTGAGADKDSDTETGAGADKDSDAGTGTDTDKDTDAGVDTDKDSDTDTGADIDKDSDTDSGADKDTDTDKNQDTGTSTDEDQDGAQSVETAVIENITWKSAPEYDGDTEGCYIFMPVIPENYILADGVALPEITVMVGELVAAFSAKGVGTPGCGTISTDTVWNTVGTLSDGELIVEPGVTLTINGWISITGKVTIKGGGTIKRGSGAAYFHVTPGADLTVGEITMDGSSISSNDSMIYTDHAKILLDDGCSFKNCFRSGNGLTNPRGGGGAMYVYGGTAVLNDVYIEGCSGSGYGGAISLRDAVMTVNGGTYRNNRDGGTYAGSVIYNMCSKLYIYDGKFINNTVNGSTFGGCIVDIGSSDNNFSNETHIYGGYFEGNKKNPIGAGGGALYFSANYGPSADTIFELAGDVRFCGDGVEGSGTDGFYLDFVDFARKISVGAPFTSPVYVYLRAKEGYVIAKGKGYTLTEKDMKQIRFTDVGNSGKQWYAWLDKAKNEIYLSEKKPPYGLYVYYSSNGATGKVEDNTEYASGTDVTVKSADALSMKGCRFKEWNTKPDGNGTPYSPGSTFEITEDMTLYAIFEESGAIKADFYSGSAGHKDVISEDLEEDADSVTITAPELQDMGGWTRVGWDENVGGYTGAIAPNTQLTISKNMSYYGVYKRNVTLSYDANGGKDSDTPAGGTGECRANVHHEITYDMAEFSVAGAIAADNSEWVFVGWNTRQDGTGDSYNENDVIEIAEDTTLYATFVKPPYANFYSGKAGEFDRRGSIVSGGSSTTGPIITPHLREKTGWEGIGWDEAKTGYEGKIKPDSKITLTEAEDNKPYYGVYEKKVTLSYQVLNNEYEGGNIPADSTQRRKAKVCESEILYDSQPDSPDTFTFDIAPDLSMDEYEFLGWNTSADGKGDYYSKEDAERNRITVTEDTVLYGIFSMAPAATFYSGSAGDYVTVVSELSDSGSAGIFTGMLTVPELKEMEGWEPVGWGRSESGYEESVETEGGRDITITEDTVFYGIYRKKVELSYDANGWLDTAPDRQSRFRYANVHSEVTSTTAEFSVGNDSSREGYTFRGWSLEKDTDGDCYRPEDTITLEESAVLYAQMVDDIAPVLGEAAYNNGYRDVDDWIVRKKDLVLTVPVTEKGSGVNRIVYTFTPENGEPVTGEALMEDAGESGQAQQTEAVWLETVSGGSAASGANGQDDMADRAGRSGGQVGTADGEIQAKITVSEDYKGAISLMCRDNAGNESPRKLLTTQGGGVIVEDNAPLISFRHKGSKNGKAVVEVTVYDNADEDSSSRITGGIASVDYRIDQKQAQSVTDQGFAEEIVETCTFEVEVAGAGEHTVMVTAADNAGNESSRSTSVRIAGDTGHKKETTVIKTSAPPAGEGSAPEPPAMESSRPAPPTEAREPELPTEKEPKTGDHAPNVEIYATLAMIAGLLYVLLYFIAEQGGMTEAEKNETVARLIAWAKRGAKIRRYAALAVIFCVLFYYHSIGKSTAEDFKKVRIE